MKVKYAGSFQVCLGMIRCIAMIGCLQKLLLRSAKGLR